MEKIKKPIKAYWNWRSKSYGYDTDKSSDLAVQWESVLIDLLADTPGKRALDIGTGTGQFAFYLAGSGFDVTGIDISEQMIFHARQYAYAHSLNIDFKTGDAEHLEFEDNTFDVIVSRNLLWTLPNPDNAIAEWRRVMKPGARLVVSDGFWKNTTWKQAHQVAFKALTGMLKNGSMISTRFFCTYAGLQKSLPFYEGISLEDTSRLLHNARFKNIRSYDTACFDIHPYGRINNQGKNTKPLFFIAYANR